MMATRVEEEGQRHGQEEEQKKWHDERTHPSRATGTVTKSTNRSWETRNPGSPESTTVGISDSGTICTAVATEHDVKSMRAIGTVEMTNRGSSPTVIAAATTTPVSGAAKGSTSPSSPNGLGGRINGNRRDRYIDHMAFQTPEPMNELTFTPPPRKRQHTNETRRVDSHDNEQRLDNTGVSGNDGGCFGGMAEPSTPTDTIWMRSSHPSPSVMLPMFSAPTTPQQSYSSATITTTTTDNNNSNNSYTHTTTTATARATTGVQTSHATATLAHMHNANTNTSNNNNNINNNRDDRNDDENDRSTEQSDASNNSNSNESSGLCGLLLFPPEAGEHNDGGPSSAQESFTSNFRHYRLGESTTGSGEPGQDQPPRIGLRPKLSPRLLFRYGFMDPGAEQLSDVSFDEGDSSQQNEVHYVADTPQGQTSRIYRTVDNSLGNRDAYNTSDSSSGSNTVRNSRGVAMRPIPIVDSPEQTSAAIRGGVALHRPIPRHGNSRRDFSELQLHATTTSHNVVGRADSLAAPPFSLSGSSTPAESLSPGEGSAFVSKR